ncbi:EF-hand calcium-binding domain-containing protein 14-like isoform X2 [Oncorhynchus keta]|uniref:EF-hand calcium-binding domain-containing protein 14-like isoform X2 n=1 Tax=Oncorhynchus keta TaxID=8018 RepID=UPI0015F996C4|nr:EF-hand calcium-binding domain-containing protein 14-like isoform X2 [Oncorhynchus keta]
MKKRKELDALIGLGDSKRKKTKKGSGHRLLRTEPPLDSESESSSDDDEFSNLATVAAFGKSYVKCCNVCYPLFLFIILAACVTACAGLIWMQIALKEDLDSLKEKLHTMESGQKVSSHEIPKLIEDLKTKQRKLEDIESGDKGLNKLWSNLTEMNRKISFLDTAVNHLKANIKSASDLINLPTTVEELQKSVASIGSTLTSVQHDVKTIQTALEDQKKETDNLKKTMDAEAKESNMKSTASVEKETSNRSSTLAQNQDVTHLREVVSEVNKTQGLYHSWTGDQIQNLQTAVSNLTQRVSSMEQGSLQTTPHSDLVEVVEQLPVSGDATEPVKDLVTERDTNADGLKAATSEATHEKSTVSKPTRRPWFLTPNRTKRESGTEIPKTVSFPGVSSLKDLKELFERSGTDPTSQGMSYQVLKKLFDTATPDPQSLEHYDKDGDQRFSLAEMKAAAGL